MGKCIDLTGKRFGRLVVIERTEDYVSPKGSRAVSWLCQCDCGCIKKVTGNSLKRRSTRSCGCLCKETLAKNFKKIYQNDSVANNKINDKKDKIMNKIVDNVDKVDNNVYNGVSFADAYSKFENWLNNQQNKSINIKSTMLWSALKFVSDMNIIDEDTMKKTYGEFMFKQMEQ